MKREETRGEGDFRWIKSLILVLVDRSKCSSGTSLVGHVGSTVIW